LRKFYATKKAFLQKKIKKIIRKINVSLRETMVSLYLLIMHETNLRTS